MNLAYLPPLHWQDFEALTLAKARCLFNDPGAQANGRPGFEQHGVDVYARHPGTGGWVGIQCKQKDASFHEPATTLSAPEIVKEAQLAKSFRPPLEHYIIATTGSRDPDLQELARQLSEINHKAGAFQISIWFWQDYVEAINRFSALQKFYHDKFPALLEDAEHDAAILNVVRTAMTRQAFNMSLGQEHPGAFHQVLIDTGTVISTGQLYDRQSRLLRGGALNGLTMLKGDIHQRGKLVQEVVAELREKYELACRLGIITPSGPWMNIHDPAVTEYLDGLRGEALREINRLLADYGINPVNSRFLNALRKPLPPSLDSTKLPLQPIIAPPTLTRADYWTLVVQHWRMEQVRWFGEQQAATVRELVEIVISSIKPGVRSPLKFEPPAIDAPINPSIDTCTVCGALRVIIENALKYSAAHDPVTVRISKRDGRFVISVENIGPGLFDEDHKAIFLEDKREMKDVHDFPAKHGISLALACSAMLQFKGEIKFDSRRLDRPTRGSAPTELHQVTFHFLLP